MRPPSHPTELSLARFHFRTDEIGSPRIVARASLCCRACFARPQPLPLNSPLPSLARSLAQIRFDFVDAVLEEGAVPTIPRWCGVLQPRSYANGAAHAQGLAGEDHLCAQRDEGGGSGNS